jgi:hypothetical protein
MLDSPFIQASYIEGHSAALKLEATGFQVVPGAANVLQVNSNNKSVRCATVAYRKTGINLTTSVERITHLLQCLGILWAAAEAECASDQQQQKVTAKSD